LAPVDILSPVDDTVPIVITFDPYHLAQEVSGRVCPAITVSVDTKLGQAPRLSVDDRADRCIVG